MHMKSFVILLLPFCISSAFAYKISIYTDQPDEVKARDVLNSFKTTYPFSQFEIEIEIKSVASASLNCGPRLGNDRLIGCDTQDITREAASRGVDQVLVVKDNPNYGGSGGSVAVITSISPSTMMLHEYLHTLGLRDEYEYKASEAVNYCSDSYSGPNMAMIEPNPDGYANDGAARGQHMGQVPWGEFIKNETLITNNGGTKLGTGMVNPNVHATPNNTNSPGRLGSAIGLYEGRTCKNANPPKATWQPGREASIMEFLDAGLGAGNEAMVAKILESRGVRRKEAPPESVSTAVNSSIRRSSKPLDQNPEVNSESPRNIAK